MNLAITTLNSKYIHPSIALRILRNDLNNHNIEHDMLEYTIKEDLDVIATTLAQYKHVAFSCYIYNIEQTKEIISKMRMLNSETIIILGGPEVSYLTYDDANLLDFDYVVCGEGEKLFVELIQSLENKSEISNEFIITLINNNLTMNLNTYIADLDYVKNLTNDYSDIDLDNQIVYLETSRGCPYQCSYCQASLDNMVRNLDLNEVLEMIKDVMHKEAKMVKFLDRTFNFDKNRTNQILNYIIENDTLKSTFQIEVTGELLDESSIDIICNKARKGLFRLEIGIQSTNELANRAIRRYQNFDKLKLIIMKLIQAKKSVLHLDLIAGLPLEDLASFKKTFNDVYDLGAQELQLGFLKLLKGTHLNELVDKYNYKFEKYAPFEIIKSDFLSQDDLNVIRIVEECLEHISNKNKALELFLYLKEKYSYNSFDLFYKLGLIIGDRKSLYEIYQSILASDLILDNEDRIALFQNYYHKHKNRAKSITSIADKKVVLHRLVENENLIQNEVFNQACVEKINDGEYYIYLFKSCKEYMVKKDR